MSSTARDLYHLLPALHRLRDEERRGALRALLEIIQEQAELIRTNIDDLYDDFFIETCAEWVVPYIGDLVANNPLYEVRTTGRADVARTLEYRHGKGTQRVLEQLARDVTGWSAHVVPFFELIGWTQNLNHLRLTPVRLNPRTDLRHGPLSFERVGTVDVRNHEVLDRFGGPFDSVAHTVDVRPPEQVNGWHNVHNAGFFLWRLESYPLSDVDARGVQAIAGEHRWHFSPIGGPAELYHEPDRIDDGSLAIESDVSAPIRPAAFFLNTKTYYGPAASLHIVRDGTPIPAAAICCMDLSAWKRPPIDRVGVDVTRGRISFPAGQEPAASCVVRTTYGFSGEMGGGPYGRTIIESEDENTKIVSVPGDAATIGAAIALALTGAQPTCVVTIRNNRTFVEDLTIAIGMKSLVIQAESQKRPTLIGSIVVKNGDSGSSNSLTLSGILVSGAIRCEDVLRNLELVHTTLVPGRGVDSEGAPLDPELPSIWAAATNSELEILLDHSIVGSIVAPAESLGITATDTIVDSASRDGQATLVPALVSGVLQPFVNTFMTSDARRMIVAVGDRAPHTISIPVMPLSLKQAAAQLQAVVRGIDDSPEHANAVVLHTRSTLVFIGGDGAQVRILPFGDDPTAEQLKLVLPAARECLVLRGANIGESVELTSGAPAVLVEVDGETPVNVPFASPPTGNPRDLLRDAIRAAGADSRLSNAEVVRVDDRVLIVPGPKARAILLHAAPADATTVDELGLFTAAAAIAGDAAGSTPGPPAKLDQVTVLGRINVRQLDASNCIFDQRLLVQRRQTGCVRFSYVAPGSMTPRRFHCQPESPATEPAFTSRHYGDAAYAQLSLGCAAEIRTGADDGAEMGAFHFLMQPQRETNLRVRLDEYLPFGLQAGLIFVT